MNRFMCSGGGHFNAATVLTKYDAGSCTVVNAGTVNSYISCGYGEGLRKNLFGGDFTQLTVGFRYTCPVLPSAGAMNILGFQANGTELLDLQVDSTGSLKVITNSTINQTPAVLIRPNVSCFIEIQVGFTSAATGFVELRHNEIQQFRNTNVVTTTGGLNTCNQIELYGVPQNLGPNIFKDIYVNDQTPDSILGGTLNTTFWGDTPIYCIFPASDGEHNDLNPSSGVNRYSMVNEHVPDITTYVSGSASGSIQTFHMDQLPSNVSSVNAMQQLIYAEKDDAGSHSIQPLLSDGATDVLGRLQTLNGNYVYLFQNYDRDTVTDTHLTPGIINQRRQGLKIIS